MNFLPSLLTVKRMNKLPSTFYTRADVVQIAKDLLGKFLVTHFDGQITAGKIVETEAYRAPEDKASHAWNNRRTRRTEVMFREGGVAYVYLCYGVHHLFNVVTGVEGMAHAVLIRAVEPADNLALMLQRRNMAKPGRQLTAGPAVLSKALGIRTEHTGLSLTAADSPIWIEDRGVKIPGTEILEGPRVGVDYAEECAHREWRFRVKDSPWTSKPF
jgi:DNA-3-methyladenine glycosylase